MSKATARSPLRALVLVGTPLVLGVLELTHPVHLSQEGAYAAILPRVEWWITLHVLQVPLLALLALAVYLLTSGAEGAAASVSRVALLVFLPFYAAWDAVAGLGTGLLVRYAAGLSGAEQALLIEAIDAFWTNPYFGNVSVIGWVGGGIAWALAVLSAAIALGKNGAPAFSVALLVPAGLLFGFSHIPPFGPLGMLCFAAATAYLQFGPRGSKESASPRGHG